MTALSYARDGDLDLQLLKSGELKVLVRVENINPARVEIIGKLIEQIVTVERGRKSLRTIAGKFVQLESHDDFSSITVSPEAEQLSAEQLQQRHRDRGVER